MRPLAFSKRALRAKKRTLPEAVPPQGSSQARPVHPSERPTTYQPRTLHPSAAGGPVTSQMDRQEGGAL